MITLGIETSCDETAVGLVEGGRAILGHSLVSSVAFHQQYGGVVPEIACRHHVELITYCVDDALRQAGLRLPDVGLVAVTYGPGLAGALLIGLAAAKSLSFGLRVPLVGVNHLQAHLYAALLGAGQSPVADRPRGPARRPTAWPARAVGLIVSGGHTALARLDGLTRYTVMGQTRDDAVGEAFDKVAKLLGLGYPGGPAIERIAAAGDPSRLAFSTPKIRGGTPWDFSFSGIKTAALRDVQQAQQAGTFDDRFRADLAASFQHAVVEELVAKGVSACRAAAARTLIVGGGVIANQVLRGRLAEACRAARIRLRMPPVALSTDNAAMVAGLGYQLHAVCGVTSPLTLTAEPNLGMR
ncbi:MAG: tRNA (adenosine(37)-N6)-threonylcarbamoyltransferase complex transferase subunit TsaD [Candidatus Omnitrophica bacterium]|nr:tRNA (adenosine(37)-N6)-threonylcarbamoyltransferase complex transferase subunit TsaD [Candidatus Omnitrophota bacterium]